MTRIEWTERTWNPLVGCSVVSPGCTNCYAMNMAARIERMLPQLEHYEALTKPSKAGPVWTGKVMPAPEHILRAPLKWKKPRRIFVNSMSDLFHENIPDRWIDRVFAVMALTPHHEYQVLTKRSRRMMQYLYLAGGRPLADRIAAVANSEFGGNISAQRLAAFMPLANVWLGVSCEDQKRAEERVPDLLATPAAVRFVSAEPLLGPIDFNRLDVPAYGSLNALDDGYFADSRPPRRRLDWIIVGGESGPGARPMHPDWVRDIRDDCQSAGVAFFFKQWGEWAPGECATGIPTRTERTATWWDDRWDYGQLTPAASEGMHCDDAPDLYRLGKKQAGRWLDGREHDDMPNATSKMTEVA